MSEAAAAAASYRVLSRLLGYGEAAPRARPAAAAPAGHGPAPPPFLARPGPAGLQATSADGVPQRGSAAGGGGRGGPGAGTPGTAVSPAPLCPGPQGPAAGVGAGADLGPGGWTRGAVGRSGARSRRGRAGGRRWSAGVAARARVPRSRPPQPQPPAAAPQAGEDPTETSDALLVLRAWSRRQRAWRLTAARKRSSAARAAEEEGAAGFYCSPLALSYSPQGCLPMQDRSFPRALESREQPQQLSPPPPPPGPLRPLAGLSRKGSLKIRLSRLFRTKSCNGGSGGGDGAGKRLSWSWLLPQLRA